MISPKRKTAVRPGSHRMPRGGARIAAPPIVDSQTSGSEEAAIPTEGIRHSHRRPRELGRVGRLATIGGLGLVLAAVPSALVIKATEGSPNDGAELSTAAASYLHSLGEAAMTTYTSAVEHGYGPSNVYTNHHGRVATINVITEQGPISETITSSRAIMGPNGQLQPDPKYATSISVYSSTSSATLSGERAVNTVPDGGYQELMTTTYSQGQQPTTITTYRAMGDKSKAPTVDSTFEVAESNVAAAIQFTEEVNQTLGNMTSTAPGSPPVTPVQIA